MIVADDPQTAQRGELTSRARRAITDLPVPYRDTVPERGLGPVGGA
jgi:hypothetical protein